MLNNKLKIDQMYVADILKTSVIHEKMAETLDFIDFFSFRPAKSPIFTA
jgi:hypothetical protein